jgi:hypothetical protein
MPILRNSVRYASSDSSSSGEFTLEEVEEDYSGNLSFD